MINHDQRKLLMLAVAYLDRRYLTAREQQDVPEEAKHALAAQLEAWANQPSTDLQQALRQLQGAVTNWPPTDDYPMERALADLEDAAEAVVQQAAEAGIIERGQPRAVLT